MTKSAGGSSASVVTCDNPTAALTAVSARRVTGSASVNAAVAAPRSRSRPPRPSNSDMITKSRGNVDPYTDESTSAV